MAKRKPTNKYYFSVEGETEQWYLKWLQDTINNTEKAACKVSIDCPVRKNPLKHAKSLTVTGKIEIYHFLITKVMNRFMSKAFKKLGQYEEGRKNRKTDKI